MESLTFAAKANARTALKGRWFSLAASAGISVFSTIIVILIAEMAGYYFDGILSLFLLIFSCLCLIFPLLLGFLRVVWREINHVEESPAAVFYYFSSWEEYRQVLYLSCLLGFRFLISSVLLFTPALLTVVLSYPRVFQMLGISVPIFMWNISAYFYIFVVLGTVALIYVMSRTYLAPFLFVINEEMDAKQAIRMSCVLFSENRADMFYFLASFLGWAILSAFLLPLLFTLPYFTAAYLFHGRFVVAAYNERFMDEESAGL